MCRVLSEMRLTSREKLLLFSFFCAAWAVMFALTFVGREYPVHAWDVARSHNMTIKLLDALSESFLVFLNTPRSSLSGSYNAVGDLLPALWPLATGSRDRAHFILSLGLFLSLIHTLRCRPSTLF